MSTAKLPKRMTRGEKVEKIIHDNLPTHATSKKHKKPSKDQSSPATTKQTCYQFQRQFIKDIAKSKGVLVKEYNMICIDPKQQDIAVQRAQIYSNVYLGGGQVGGEELVETINKALATAPFLTGYRVAERTGAKVSQGEQVIIPNIADLNIALQTLVQRFQTVIDKTRGGPLQEVIKDIYTLDFLKKEPSTLEFAKKAMTPLDAKNFITANEKVLSSLVNLISQDVETAKQSLPNVLQSLKALDVDLSIKTNIEDASIPSRGERYPLVTLPVTMPITQPSPPPQLQQPQLKPQPQSQPQEQEQTAMVSSGQSESQAQAQAQALPPQKIDWESLDGGRIKRTHTRKTKHSKTKNT